MRTGRILPALRLLAGIFAGSAGASLPAPALAQYTDYRIATNESTGKTGVAAPAGIQMLGLKQTGTANAIAAIGDAAGRTIIATEAAAPLATNIAQWGGTATTLGQKAMAASAPVVLASDQTVIPVSDNAGSLTVDAPAGTPVAVRQSDGAAFQTFEVVDVDTGAPAVNRIGTAILLPGAGGAVVGGTSANPVRTDPTGTTAQPVTDNAASLTVDAPVATPVAVRISDGAAFISPALDRTTAAAPSSTRLSDGAAFYDSTKTGQLPAALVGGRLDVVVGAALPTGANVIGALSANQTVNVAQINGVTPLMGNGVTGTGAQRVSIASDSTGIVGQGDGWSAGSGRPLWSVGIGQRNTLFNTSTTGAADTAVTTTIAGAASSSVYLYKFTARCSAGTATVTVKDGATLIWGTPTGAIGTANATEQWSTPLATTSAAALEVQLTTCGAANTGTLAVQASRF